MQTGLGLAQAAGFGAFVVLIAALLLVVFVLASAVRTVQEYERGVVFRLGRVREGAKGPGLILPVPVVDRMIVMDPNRSVIEVENHVLATSQISQTTLRSVLGQKDLDDLLTNREAINEELQAIIDEQTDPWGVKVSVVEVKDVEIPQQMQRAMARQAESERERRAKIIAAEGEYQASQRLRQAADRLESPTALQLRLFQTMGEIAVNQNSTIILPVPIDLLRPYLSGPDGSSDGSRGDYEARAQRERVEEEKEAERLYEETMGDVSREVSSEEVATEMPDGEASR